MKFPCGVFLDFLHDGKSSMNQTMKLPRGSLPLASSNEKKAREACVDSVFLVMPRTCVLRIPVSVCTCQISSQTCQFVPVYELIIGLLP
jgi:hypothetical protein